MKKIYSLVFMVVFIFVTSGCGKNIEQNAYKDDSALDVSVSESQNKVDIAENELKRVEKYIFVEELSALNNVAELVHYDYIDDKLIELVSNYEVRLFKSDFDNKGFTSNYDLTGDGKDEVISLHDSYIKIDDLYVRYISNISDAWIVDFNLNDSHKELVLYSPGPSDDPVFYIIYYNGNKYECVEEEGWPLLLDKDGNFFVENSILTNIEPKIVLQYYTIDNNGLTCNKYDLMDFNIKDVTFKVNGYGAFLEDKDNLYDLSKIQNVIDAFNQRGISFTDEVKFNILGNGSSNEYQTALYIQLEDGRIGWLFMPSGILND